MCTVVLSVGQHPGWPLLLGANRDERLDRPWLPPACHWPDRPDMLAGLDTLGGGTWLGINRAGVVAAVLNRAGSLGPAPGKASRGELPLLALAHATALAAVRALAAPDAGRWRSFNLVIADRAGAYCLRGAGQGAVNVQVLPPGTHMVTACDPDDMASPRVARNLPLFRRAPLPEPPDWSSWTRLLSDGAAQDETAINITPRSGFGTVSSSLVAIGATTILLAANGPPDAAPFEEVGWPERSGVRVRSAG